MYLDNKYTKCYYSIIDRAKSRELPKESYKEIHHIIPKCLGGSNAKENLVSLTAQEHRLVHILLPKMLSNTAHIKKMWYAAWMILRVENLNQIRQISKGKFYEIAKLNFSQSMSARHKGKIVSTETRQKMSESRKCHSGPNKGKTMSTEQKLKLSKAHKGKVVAQSTVDKILESRKGYKHSEETKQKISKSQIGKIMPAKTDAQKKDMSEKMKGRIMSDETKQRMSAARKAYWDAKRAA
jgi:hypothetical protein